MDWESKYLDAIMNRLRPAGDVLLVGFGDGRAATEILKYFPAVFTILEPDPKKADSARKKCPAARLVEERWETALPQLSVFDVIFYNERGDSSFFENLSMNSVLKEGARLMEEMDQHFPELHKIRYSDADLDAFCETAATSSKEHLSQFLNELVQNGQISTEQRKKITSKYHLKAGVGLPPRIEAERLIDPMVLCLNACWETHLRKGGRFSCYSPEITTKTEDPFFSETIIVNPSLHVSETSFPIPHSKKEALLLLVEKLV